jgi:ribose 5-phosphate isomerase A
VTIEREKQLAAEASALLVEDGMRVGLGTGSTVAYLLPALGARKLEITCVATSPATEEVAIGEGLRVVPFDELDDLKGLDMAIDGADQVDPEGWLVKGGGGAHTREKIVAAAANRFIVIVSSNKLVEHLGPPVPLEIERAGLEAVLRDLPDVVVRAGAALTPDGGVLADWLGPVEDPATLASRLAEVPGVVSHGLFPSSMVDRVLVGRGEDVEVIPIGGLR